MSVVVVAAGLGAVAAITGWFVRLERTDRREVIFGVILAVLLVEMFLNGDEGDVASGLFRIPLAASGDLRPPDVLLPSAIVARLLVCGLPARFTKTGMLWAGFIAWYAGAAVMGLLRGNPTEDLIFQARAILYIGGGYLVASGVQPQRLVTRRATARMARVVGGTAAVLTAAIFLGVTWSVELPGIPIEDLGATFNVDVLLALVIIGAVLLALEASRKQRRTGVVLFALAMFVPSLTTTQAGSIVALGVVIAGLAASAFTSTWRRRMRVASGDLVVLVAVIALVSIPLAAIPSDDGPRPLENVSVGLFSETQETTSLRRVSLWSEAVDVIEDHPVLGAGLGIQHPLPRPWPLETIQTGAHNVVLDVGARAGIVGVILLLVAVHASLRDGLRMWREHHSDRLAALALGCLLGLAAFFTRALVEPSLEKFRHAAILGLLIGLVAAIAASYESHRTPDAEPEGESVEGVSGHES